MMEVCIITDHRPLVAIVRKDVAMLPLWLQFIILGIHHNRVHIIYKPGPDLYIIDWLSCNNHTEERDQKIAGMSVNMNSTSTSVNVPVCTSKEDKQAAAHEDAHL